MANSEGKGRQLRRAFAATLFSIASTVALVFPTLTPALGRGISFTSSPEQGLAKVFEAIEENRTDLALQRVDAIIGANPNFRLAHLIRGDLLLARLQPIHTFGNLLKTVPPERVEELRAEALARLRALRDRPPDSKVPSNLLQLRTDQTHALVVDSRRSRVFVFENSGGNARYVSDFYVTLGKHGVGKTREGDQKDRKSTRLNSSHT